MNALINLLGGAGSLLVVALGFGAIIFIHELGHFLAAKWARIRVLAFAVGFGPAIVSYRKGIGLQRGSSEAAYQKRLARPGPAPEGISPTEYRLNALPLGGYVKMLGQEDLHPEATSEANDSYQAAPVWKRMVVISAGVIMNLISAAVLFVIVFMIGLQTEPPKVGGVVPGSPADRAVASNAEALGIERPGLMPGDRIVSINGRTPASFNDIVLSVAMARSGQSLGVVVERPGIRDHLDFRVVPDTGRMSGLLELGIAPAASAEVRDPGPALREIFIQNLASAGLPGVEPGMRLVAVGGEEPENPADHLGRVFDQSQGRSVEVVFEGEDGRRVALALEPTPELMTVNLPTAPRTVTPIEHLLGLVGVMAVASAEADQPGAPSGTSRGYEQGLRTGDVFVRVGETVYPSMAEGMRTIRDHAGRSVPVTVLRHGDFVDLSLSVRRNGTVGFQVASTLERRPGAEPGVLIAAPPRNRADREGNPEPWRPAAASLVDQPGLRLLAIDGREVSSVVELRSALIDATRDAGEGATVAVRLALPIARGTPGAGVVEREWALDGDAVAELQSLGWLPPGSLGIFEFERTLLRAEGPVQAVGMGVHETHRVMMSTYLTLVRLFQGTVRVEHLRGPVGIAHMGTQILDRGFIWLLFFFGLISVNLAVINFLPIPIVDGGQFLMLVYEGIRRKPVPIALQNALTLAGLALIGSVFVVVTFYDVRNLFGL